jgi:hypothetical protein
MSYVMMNSPLPMQSARTSFGLLKKTAGAGLSTAPRAKGNYMGTQLAKAAVLIRCAGLVIGLAGCLAVFAQVMFASVPAADRWPFYAFNAGCALLVVAKVFEWISRRPKPVQLEQ